MKLIIYYGKKPLKAIGKNQCKLLHFAFKYPVWHTFKQDKVTKRAITALQKKNYIQVINDQFKINL